MNINAYTTYIGKPYGHLEQIELTAKRLALLNDLPRLADGVYQITHDTGEQLPFFTFPLTTLGLNRKPITIIDDRPFTNKSGVIINPSERVAFLTAGFIQHDALSGNTSVVDSTRNIVARAFTRAFGGRIIQRANLDADEAFTVSVAICHYYTCMTEHSAKGSDYQFISANVIKSAINATGPDVIRIIESMGYISTLKELFDYLVAVPGMYKLKSTSFKDFIALGQTIWFSSIGRQVVGVALEFVPLLIGITAACIANKSAYGKTGMGMQLDPKNNESNNRAFRGIIGAAYPIQL